MSLIAQFGPGLYRFGGSLREALGSDNFKTFEGTGRCRDDAGTLQFEGMYRYTGAMSLSHSFVVKMTSPPRSLADEIEVAAAPMGILRGHGVFVMRDAFEVLLTAPSGYAVAAHIELLPRKAFRLQGIIKLSADPVAFMLTAGPAADREVVAGVLYPNSTSFG